MLLANEGFARVWLGEDEGEGNGSCDFESVGVVLNRCYEVKNEMTDLAIPSGGDEC